MKNNLIKRPIVILVSALMFILTICYYFIHIDITSAATGITYRRHDCSSSSNTSYRFYTLAFDDYGTSTASQIGENNMVRDDDETSVVRLSTRTTGFIVDDHVIATAAHCVYYDVDNDDVDEYADFTISIVGSNNTVITTIEPAYIHIPAYYAVLNDEGDEEERKLYDYALIYVEEDLSDYGQIPLGIARDEFISNAGQVSVSGFPGVYPEGYQGNSWGIRFKASGSLSTLSTSNALKHYVDTIDGDSGGPLYVEEALWLNNEYVEYKTAIGIHGYGTDPDNNITYNQAVRVTPDILKFYYSNPNISE